MLCSCAGHGFGVLATEDPISSGHNVRAGRPDFGALVRAAAMGARGERLVVAACGPAGLVASAHKAVVSVRNEWRGVIEFAGSDPRW